MLATTVPVRLDHLPTEQAAAVLLAARPGVTYREVAERLGLEPSVVLQHLKDALRSARPAASTGALPATA